MIEFYSEIHVVAVNNNFLFVVMQYLIILYEYKRKQNVEASVTFHCTTTLLSF